MVQNNSHQERLPENKKLLDSNEGTILYGEEKEKYLTDKINQEKKDIEEMSSKLTQTKIEVETDETMLLRHK